MAVLYITEYAQTERWWTNISVQVPKTPAVTSQTVDIGVSSAQSNAFNGNTNLIRAHTDVVCSVEVGGIDPTATTSSARMAANQTEYFAVNPGDKIAVITNL